MEIQRELDTINKEIDKNENNIRKMEHFIDKYIPFECSNRFLSRLRPSYLSHKSSDGRTLKWKNSAA